MVRLDKIKTGGVALELENNAKATLVEDIVRPTVIPKEAVKEVPDVLNKLM